MMNCENDPDCSWIMNSGIIPSTLKQGQQVGLIQAPWKPENQSV